MPLPPDPEADAIDVEALTSPPEVGTAAWRALIRHRREELGARYGIDPMLVVVSGVNTEDPDRDRLRRKRASRRA